MTGWLLRLLCILVPSTILLAGPSDAILRRFWRGQPLRTWHYETLAVATFVAAIVLMAGNDPIEWVGFAALVLSHGRNSVMFRLTEAQRTSEAEDPHHVECWRWNTVYLHKSWAALCGVVVFVGYSRWRAWYVNRSKGRGA